MNAPCYLMRTSVLLPDVVIHVMNDIHRRAAWREYRLENGLSYCIFNEASSNPNLFHFVNPFELSLLEPALSSTPNSLPAIVLREACGE